MPNIYLVGFMGTGKTETAKILASRLRRLFVDMDTSISTTQKMSIAEIFKTKGELYFRKLEKDLVAELSAKDDLVVACGGGAFADQANIDLLKKTGTVICLTSTPAMILERTRKFTTRPLLNVKDPLAKIEELLNKRQPFYAQAHYTVDADQLTVAETAEKVLQLLEGTP